MIALLQRVSAASVDVGHERVGTIGRGLLVFVGVVCDDDELRAARLARRVLGYRIFPDTKGRMNLSVLDVRGAVLVVPQFTLAADTDKGMRASFTTAAEPGRAENLCDYFASQIVEGLGAVERGRFGADMRVSLVNEGPVTFLLNA